jgi:hypothetical protein
MLLLIHLNFHSSTYTSTHPLTLPLIHLYFHQLRPLIYSSTHLLALYTANTMAEGSPPSLHSGGIALTSIPVLEDQPGWEDWIRHANGWLINHDYDEPAPVIPLVVQTRSNNNAEDPNPKALANWKRGQKKAIAGLKSRCGKRAYGICQHIDILDDLLDTLKAEFKPKGEGVFNEIYNRWENVNLADCKDVNDYCTQFDQIRTELKDLNAKCILPRPILVKKFLQGLGPAFSSWEMSFNQQHSIIGNEETPGVTLLEAQSSARVEEQRLKGNNTSIGMLATNRYGKRPRQALNGPTTLGGRWCYNNCNHPGHWDHECWIQHPELRLIWEAKHPEKAAQRNTANREKRARLGRKADETTTSASSASIPISTSACLAITGRTTNLF